MTCKSEAYKLIQ